MTKIKNTYYMQTLTISQAVEIYKNWHEQTKQKWSRKPQYEIENDFKSITGTVLAELSKGKQLIRKVNSFFFIVGDRLREVDNSVIRQLIEAGIIVPYYKALGSTYFKLK